MNVLCSGLVGPGKTLATLVLSVLLANSLSIRTTQGGAIRGVGITYINGDVACNAKVRSERRFSCPMRLRGVLNSGCLMNGFNGPNTALLGRKRHPCVRRRRCERTVTFENSVTIVRLNVGSASPEG